MQLDVYFEDRQFKVNIPDLVVNEGEEFFAKMDKDMDGGWKMGHTFVENPDSVMRAQIAAHKLVTAIENGNETLGTLMAGYIVSRVPGTVAVRVDPQGEMLNTEIIQQDA